jgi:Rrf2 family protein
MKLSTKARYGLRFMIELAANYSKGPVYLKDIAKDQDISDKYLSRIAIDLKGIGLVDAFRGANGGYVLTKAPAQISVYQIVNSLEGDLAPVDCVRNDGACKRSCFCASREAWRKLDEAISSTLSSMSLADMLAAREQKSTQQLTYYI